MSILYNKSFTAPSIEVVGTTNKLLDDSWILNKAIDCAGHIVYIISIVNLCSILINYYVP